jgi:transient receptor potential cation channel subfamily M protein 7
MLEYKTKAEMSHIPQSQDAHQMTMEDSENNFQNIAEEIPMVRRKHFVVKKLWCE